MLLPLHHLSTGVKPFIHSISVTDLRNFGPQYEKILRPNTLDTNFNDEREFVTSEMGKFYFCLWKMQQF